MEGDIIEVRDYLVDRCGWVSGSLLVEVGDVSRWKATHSGLNRSFSSDSMSTFW